MIWRRNIVISSLRSEIRNKEYYRESRKENKKHVVLDNTFILRFIQSLLSGLLLTIRVIQICTPHIRATD